MEEALDLSSDRLLNNNNNNLAIQKDMLSCQNASKCHLRSVTNWCLLVTIAYNPSRLQYDVADSQYGDDPVWSLRWG